MQLLTGRFIAEPPTASEEVACVGGRQTAPAIFDVLTIGDAAA